MKTPQRSYHRLIRSLDTHARALCRLSFFVILSITPMRAADSGQRPLERFENLSAPSTVEPGDQRPDSSPLPFAPRTEFQNLPAGSPAKGTRPALLDPWVTGNRIIEDVLPASAQFNQQQAEPHVFRSRANPAVLLAVFQEGRQTNGGATTTGYAVSSDGGTTWRHGIAPQLTVINGGPYSRASDPVAAIDLNGTMFLNSLAIVGSQLSSYDVTINRSLDGGVTWSPPINVFTGTAARVQPDKNWIAVNDHPGAPRANRLAVTFTNFTSDASGQANGNHLVCLTSDNAGLTWSGPIAITPQGSNNQGTQPVFLPDGSLIVFYSTFFGVQSSSFYVEFKRSLDGGTTWPATATRVATVTNPSGDPVVRSGSFIFSAAAGGNSGSLFLAWTEVVAGSPSIMTTRSTDLGASWSQPVKVNATPQSVSVLSPTISCSLDGQMVCASWLDKRLAPDGRNFIDVYGASSANGGVTWGPDFRLSDRTTDVRNAVATSSGFMIGDYFGLAAGHTSDQPSVAVWVDTRAGQSDPVVTRFNPAQETTYDGWKKAHFFPGIPAGSDSSNPASDSDMDGFSNAFEYAYGLDPLEPDFGSAYGLTTGNDSITLNEPSFPNRPAPGRWEYSVDRQTWLLALIHPTITGGAGTSVLQKPNTAPLYFRRVIELPGYSPVVSSETPVLGSTSRLTNLSTRGFAGGGESTLIAGFITNGGSLRSLIRGIGPQLSTFGLAGVLNDPKFTIAPSPFPTAIGNDNWGDASSTIADDFAAVGAFPLRVGSRDAALVATLSSQQTTVLITGADGGTGVALAELYLMPSGSDPGAKLINLSTRGQVGSGENVMIGGFILQGIEAKRCLIRAVGPALSQFNIVTPLSDPMVQLFRAGESVPIATNDDWSLSPSPAAIKASATQTGAFELADNTRDAVILVTLPPGVYTAVVSGVGSTTGIALVEIYTLD